MGKGGILFTKLAGILAILLNLVSKENCQAYVLFSQSSSTSPFVNRSVDDLADYINQNAKYICVPV